MAKIREGSLRFRVVLSPEHKQLYDFLLKVGGFYRGRHLIRLASIGLSVEQGVFQFSEITVKPSSGTGNQDFTVEKPSERKSTRKKVTVVEEKPAGKHYEIPADAADALSSMFDSM